ncbi:MAG TPA: xanthine dehydrogenase family protein molybdopterin-binding subunit [Acetobacteraceae bacterium]|nr:xanthine dehydrogenase family protein molybdopterin-binding subunit [Acetobacteraceae bacterium]
MRSGIEARPALIGARVPRLEDPRLLTGRGRFAADRLPRDALHVAIRRSDHPHARIAAIRTEQAAAAPGVVAVFDAASLENDAMPLRAVSRMKDYHATVLRPLAADVVRYVGEPVVAVVAESRYLAEDAAELIEIDYDPLPVAVSAMEAADTAAPRLHEDAAGNVLVSRGFARGDVNAVFAEAAATVAATFRMTRKSPAAIEPRACVAEWDAGRGLLTLHSTTQIPGIVRDALVDALGLPSQRVRLVGAEVGGGFGGKASVYAEEILIAAIARRLECSLAWCADRLEDLSATSQAFDETVEAVLAVDAEGHLLGLSADVLGDVGAGSIYPWTCALEPVQVASFLPGPYRLPAYRATARGVATPKPPTGPYRGVGRPMAAFVMERLIDMAAHRLGIDPVEMRRRNLVRADEFPYRAASGLVWDRSGFLECLEMAVATADYPALRREQAAAREAGRWVGIGVACYAELTGIGTRISVAPGMPINTGTETATVRIDSSGGVTVAVGVAANGQGLETTLAQVAAETLGCRIDEVRVIQGDSDAVANATGSYASRSAVLAGGAITVAAGEVRERLKRAAAHLLEAAEADLEVADGMVRVAGTDRALTFRQVARAVYSEMGRIPREKREELAATESYDPFFGTAASATHLAMVEIDPDTFGVRVLRYVVAEDCGRVINPLVVEGQVHGGVVQGIGAALLEEIVYDAHGQLTTASFADYLLPSAAEAPPIEVVHVETVLPENKMGARGMGEGGTIGAPAAIANAIADALAPLGIEITTLPATEERLFRLLAAAQAQEEGRT